MVSSTSKRLPYDRCGPQQVEDWLQSLAAGYAEDERAVLRRATALAAATFGDDKLASGESRLSYAIAVADILAGLKLDAETLVAAILEGLPGDDGDTLEQLSNDFGSSIAGMVDDLQRIAAVATASQPSGKKSKSDHAENLRRLFLGLAKDVRVVLVVVAERLHLMRSIKTMADEPRRRIAQETQDIYAPLANRLGIWQIKWELEDLCLRYLEPEEYRRVASLLDGRREDRELFIGQIITLLDEKFKAAGIQAKVTGRPKHIYSIWRKMTRKSVDFEQIFDVRAIRVLVNDIADCYAALGVVHGLWRHIPGEFDDYIATPKTNLYQSLHTAVIGPEDKPLEIQIRTLDMHRHAELGVAAHWRYKETARHDNEFERRLTWMRHWLELKDDEDFIDQFQAELEPTQIYVLTPHAKVLELPKGSTPVDFAYAIHSDVGHKCRGARVNGRIVPLAQELQSGQTVEIITAKNGSPSRDWLSPQLGYIKTSRARSRVRQWFKYQDYEHHISIGKTNLDREIQRLGITDKPDLEAVAKRYNFQHADDVYAAIGRGDLSPIQVAGQGGEPRPAKRSIAPEIEDQKYLSRPARGEVIVAGEADLMTHMARCCKPVPHDPILGFITRGRGVTVHRDDCVNLLHLSEDEQQRLVQVTWSDQPSGMTYPVDILIWANDRKGLLRDISSVLTNDEVNVIGVSTVSDRQGDTASMRFTVEISDITQLSRLIDKVAQLPDVLEAKRAS